MKAEKYFYSATACLFLILMLNGFHAFLANGKGFRQRPIDSGIVVLDAVHGGAIALWFVLFLVQSLLIASRNRKLHMTLGWSALVLGPVIACLGTLVAFHSVELSPNITFFGMLYSRFMLVMFTEMAMFALFLTAGILTRKKPRIHRTMMLMTSLTLIPGALVRTAPLNSIFGESGWTGLFGSLLVLGALLFFVRWAMTRTFDRWYVASYALLAVAYIGSTYLANTATWDHLAAMMLR
jgi:hypothetical protein